MDEVSKRDGHKTEVINLSNTKKRTFWTEELIKSELIKSIELLEIKRMPTGSELKSIGRNDLHLKIGRTKTYRGWAAELGLQLKSSCTLDGQYLEDRIEKMIKYKGYSVERMSTKYPYDLLVNGSVKIDVKLSNPNIMRGSRVHTFGISKSEPTCDLYICAAKDEQGNIERLMIIPSHKLRVVTLCIGKESVYNKFINRWDLLDQYIEFHLKVG